MPVFALYQFNDTDTNIRDAALANGAQDGLYMNGAAASGGQVLLDGVNDIAKIFNSPVFQMDRGTLAIEFTQTAHVGLGPNTVLSRDSVGNADGGGFRIEVLVDGAIVVSHETPSDTVVYRTDPGFLQPGDRIDLSYSWDRGGAEPGRLVIQNLDSGASFTEDVPNTLTMNTGTENQNWIVGAGQSASPPNTLAGLDKHFNGTAEYLSFSDTVDNKGNTDPTPTPDTAETDEDTSITIPVLDNDTDPDGDPLTVTGGSATNGSVTVNPDGTITYTPNPNFNGSDTITYTVDDGNGGSATSTVSVTVNPVNDAPVAEDDAISTPFNTPVTIAVLDNDSDADGDPLAVSGTPTSADGTVVVNPNGTITFTPTAGFTGTAVIDYTITDPDGLTDTAQVLVSVGTNGAPTPTPDTAETDEDTSITIPVLDNDTDPDGDPLTVTGGSATNGSVTVNPDGTITYTPNPNFNGSDTITYTVDDGNGGSATSTVSVTVNPVNDAPVAEDDAISTPFNTPVTIAVLDNDSDADGDPLAVSGTPTSADGTVVVNPNGTITFTPTAGFTGTAVIDYTITDPDGLTDTAQVLVTVESLPPPPPPTRDGIVRGTRGDDLIDLGYIDPRDADRIDADDAILPGEAPNDDIVLAGIGNDTVLAGLGDDDVQGAGGDDVLRGEDGNDLLRGGDGNDLIIGDDTLPLPDRAYPGLYPADTDPFDNRDTLRGGNGDDTILGGDDADDIQGNRGNDFIDGGVDDDLIEGGYGDDTIIGGEGSDTIYGNQDNDLIYGGLGPTAPDAINIRDDQGDLVPDNGRDLIFGGYGRDTIFGLDDDDTIYGGANDDVIDAGIDDDVVDGDGGNDTIIGGQGADTMRGSADRDVFIINAPDHGIGDSIDGGEAGDDFDTLDLRGAGPLRVTFDSDNVENGVVTYFDGAGNVTGTTRFINIENVVPCFTPGTLIATPRGEVPVETLKVGDRIITRDNGLQEIRWVGRRDMTAADFAVAPHLRPVLIRKGSLGSGLPERDMLVSPNHRVLVANDRTALYFDEHEVLVSAKHLVAGDMIKPVASSGTAYIHFMCDRHEVVLSNGAWTETFQPGDQTLKGMGNSQRSELFEIFPELKTPAGVDSYAAARKTLKRHEALLLVK